jgi:uncharacterized protein YaaW (UPF0174 family)
MTLGRVKSIIAILLIAAVCTIYPLEAYGYYFFSTRRTESPNEFHSFLEECTPLERIQLLQSLDALPKLKKEHFGNLKGLAPYYHFSDNDKDATTTRPRRPKTFNQVAPETVYDAVNRRLLEPYDIFSVENIKKNLVYLSNNKLTYYFRNTDEVDYHSIVQWVAGKNGASENQIKYSSTFDLERMVCESIFANIWDNLTVQQRKELLDKIEKETNTIFNKVDIASMSGGAAIAALSTTVALTGFNFYITLSVTLHWLAGLLGITLPFVVYTTSSTMVAILTGPVGWIISTGLIFWSLGSAEEQTVAKFIMTVSLIKQNKWGGKS